MPSYRMGRTPSSPRHLARRLRLSKYLDLTRILPLIPARHDPPPSYLCPMYDNDQLGDCTAAAIAHIVGENSLSTYGREIIFTSPQIRDFYFGTSGGVDQGANMGDCLQRWRSVGMIDSSGKAHRILGYAALDRGNLAQLEAAQFLFDGAIFSGAALPDRVVPPGQDWVEILWDGNDGLPNPYNGHAFSLPGYEKRGGPYWRTTWGDCREGMDGAFYTAFCDEIYVAFTEDLLDEATDKSADGFSRAELLADLDEVTGVPPEPPPPDPGPDPKPPSCGQKLDHWLVQGAALPLWPSGVRV